MTALIPSVLAVLLLGGCDLMIKLADLSSSGGGGGASRERVQDPSPTGEQLVSSRRVKGPLGATARVLALHAYEKSPGQVVMSLEAADERRCVVSTINTYRIGKASPGEGDQGSASRTSTEVEVCESAPVAAPIAIAFADGATLASGTTGPDGKLEVVVTPDVFATHAGAPVATLGGARIATADAALAQLAEMLRKRAPKAGAERAPNVTAASSTP